MNYELAKELKDAGFPGSGLWTKSNNDELLTGPTLGQLIEACGDSFAQVGRDDQGWYARGAGGPYCQGYTTPEEAVARLWLALQAR